MKVTIGADPEVFVVKDGKVIPADNIVPEPVKFSDGSKCFFDGFALEMNIPPSNSPQEFAKRIQGVKRNVRELLAEHGCTMRVAPAVRIAKDQKELEAVLAKAHPKARIFGCDPALRVYNIGEASKPEVDASKHLYRYGGGHLHLGLPELLPQKHDCGGKPQFISGYQGWGCDCGEPVDTSRLQRVIVAMDAIAALAIFQKEDAFPDAGLRRQYYGKTGECRFQPHGMEYRVPSNYWLASQKEAVWLAKQGVKAAHLTEGLLKAFVNSRNGHILNILQNLTSYVVRPASLSIGGKDLCAVLEELSA